MGTAILKSVRKIITDIGAEFDSLCANFHKQNPFLSPVLVGLAMSASTAVGKRRDGTFKGCNAITPTAPYESRHDSLLEKFYRGSCLLLK
ncbi:MAG: hypothetical protein QNJ55_23745 [Xenococcus sp. MO_188.B8]|nr:hypothetical protein [Xenococcus sp. MO_188.B8]